MSLLRQATIQLVLVLMLASCGGGKEGALTERRKASGAVATTIDSSAHYRDLVIRLYLAYFGRPPDPGGMSFYTEQFRLANAPVDFKELSSAYGRNATIKALVDSFGESQESKDLYGTDNNGFITAVYQNIFNREPDATGKAFWLDVLQRGVVTRANMAISIMGGARSTDVTVVDKKVAVSGFWTASLDTADEQAAYSGLASNLIARQLIRTVGESTNEEESKQAVSSALKDLVATAAIPVKPDFTVVGFATMDQRMAGARIDLVCIDGAKTTTHADSVGRFTLQIVGEAFPCVVAAHGTGEQFGFIFHSAITGFSTARVSPITDAALALALDRNPSEIDFGAQKNYLSKLTSTALISGASKLREVMPAEVKLPSDDPFTVQKGGNVDAFQASMAVIRKLLIDEDMDWEDAIAYVRLGENWYSKSPFITSVTPWDGLPGEMITVKGTDLPPSPRIVFQSSIGEQITANLISSSSSNVQFLVPQNVKRGMYRLLANGFDFFPLGFFVKIPDPDYYAPFYQSGKMHNRIQSDFARAADALNHSMAGSIFRYPGRERSGVKCSVRINDDGSISRLDENGKIIEHYSWENKNDDPLRAYPRLYMEPKLGKYVELVPQGLSIPAHSFAFSHSYTSAFDLCVGPGADSGFQFFAGPATKNWAKLKEGKYAGGWVYAIEGYKHSFYEEGGIFSTALNRKINGGDSYRCGFTVSQGIVRVWLTAEDDEEKELPVATFLISDKFTYEPPIDRSNFSTSEIFHDPLIAPENNYRLLSAKPFEYSNEPKFVLEPKVFHPDGGMTFYVHYGVYDYDYAPGKFRAEGYLHCDTYGEPWRTPI
ncbi:DUF4214 domain-containing protein [Pseudoduganella sp. OTU4001]|uniref:DUF4214 domain-containing protein n=1 Tax=Pseudoduganella sp. OTU4001 TaxID=3043854 RepID=UPI00313E8B45